jgi:hypothetical protein
VVERRATFAAMKRRTALIAFVILGIAGTARAAPPTIRCDDLSTEDLAVDGVLDDWQGKPLTRMGTPDSAVDVRCSWDGTALALAIRVDDDRIVRVRGGRAHEDSVDIKLATGGRPTIATVKPGNAIAKSVITRPPRSAVADSLQPKGFQIEARFPAAILAGFSTSTPAITLEVAFHDSDKATGGADRDLVLVATIELGDRKDLLDDFLRTVKLKRTDVRFDQLAELDPDRKGKERIVAGGTVIGVLTDKFAYVSLPAAKPVDVLRVELLPLGNRRQSIVSALVRQAGNGGTRELLMLWTVWSGQLEPLASIEVKKQLGAKLLEASWKIVKGRKSPELWLEPKPAIGFTAETWNEEPARDVDSIVVPWDVKKGGIAYFMDGKAIAISRRDLPAPKKRR